MYRRIFGMYTLWVMQAYRTMTAAMMRIITPLTSPPRYAPTSAAAFEVGGSITSCGSGVEAGLGCGSGVQEGVHTLTMVAVWLSTDITVLVLAALSWNIWISVDAVISPLSVEYTTVVVKIMVLLSSAEQVTSDSSKSEEVKLQEHIPWIALVMPVFSISWASFWKMINPHTGNNNHSSAE